MDTIRTRTALLMALVAALGVGVGFALSSICGRAAPVVVQVGDSAAPGGPIRVYVSGAVQSPGVYPLQAGDRIVEAVAAAGGPAADADTEAVNFAERIEDGEHIHVPAVGEAPPAAAASPTAVASGAAERVDLNRADVNLLRSLPGVGATRAANIVASRQRDGPFRRTDDLVQRKLVTQSIYAQIKDRISVGP